MGSDILVEQGDGYQVFTLNAPQRRNALGWRMIDDLSAAFAAARGQVGAVVLCGAPPAFCSGSDLKELAVESVQGMCTHEAHSAALARQIVSEPYAVIACVEGFALGGGFILAASCDVVVSAADARWHLPEVSNGWLPPWGLSALTARVGPVRARALVLGFEPIDGAEAHRIGVADFIAEPGEALATGRALADKICALPREAMAQTKQYFEAEIAGGAADADRIASQTFALGAASRQAQRVFAKFSRTS